MIKITRELEDIIKTLEGKDGKQIDAAIRTLPIYIEDFVVLSRKNQARLFKSLLVAMDEKDVNVAEVIGAINLVISEMIDKLGIIIPEEQALSYEWYLGILEEGAEKEE